MEPRGTVQLWMDHSRMGVDLAESLRDHGWIVKTIFTGSRTPTASHEAGCFAHGYLAIKVLFSLSEPCPWVVSDLSDETKRSLLAGAGEMAHIISVDPVIHDPKEYLPTKSPTAAEEPYDDDDDDDDDDWDDDDLDDDDDDDDDDEDWDDDGLDDKYDNDGVKVNPDEYDNDGVKQLEFKYTLHPDDLKPICDISELKKGDLITIADTIRTSIENELVWKITHDETQQGILAKVTTVCGAIMVVKLQQGDVCTKVGHIDEDDWFDSASTKATEIYRSDISVLKKGDFIVLQNHYRGRKWEVMQDGEGQQTISLQCECVHEDGCGTSVGFTTLRMGDYWRKTGLIGEPDMTPSGAAGIKETRKPDDRRDDIFKQMFNQ